MNKTLTRLFTGGKSRQGLWIVPLLITIILSIALIFQTDQFLNSENLFNLVAQAMPLIITAVGQLFVILVGGLDLSVGSLISFTTAILALDAPGYILIPAVFLLAALLGLTNGYVITRLNVHPIIATLAMQYIVLGAARILRPVSGGTIPDVVIRSVSGSFLGIPMPIFWGICVALLAWKLLYGSRFGLHLFAIGGGISSGVEDATRNFGVADKRNVILAYVACSCFAALAGVFLAGRIVSGDPNVGLLRARRDHGRGDWRHAIVRRRRQPPRNDYRSLGVGAPLQRHESGQRFAVHPNGDQGRHPAPCCRFPDTQEDGALRCQPSRTIPQFSECSRLRLRITSLHCS